jgi:hypothetical protein
MIRSKEIGHWSLLAPLILNLMFAFSVGNRLIPFIDQEVYLDQARHVAAGKGITTSFSQLEGFVVKDEPTSFWGVGAQLLYAAEIRVLGQNYTLMRICNVLLFGCTLFYTRRIFLMWLPQRSADLATLLIGCSPFFAFFNQLFMTEMPFLLCQQAFVFHLFQTFRIGSPRQALAAGLFAGAGLTVRAVLLPILPLTVVLIWLERTWKAVVAFIAGCLLLAAPYAVRNSLAVHAWFPLGGKGAYNLWFFNADVHDRGLWAEDFGRMPPKPDWSGLNEKQRADLVQGIGRRWILDHPAKFARLALIKGIAFLNPWPKHIRSGIMPVALGAYANFIMLGFAIGLFSLRFSDREHLFVLLLFVMYLGVDMVFMPASRHRMLYDPFLVLVMSLRFAPLFRPTQNPAPC